MPPEVTCGHQLGEPADDGAGQVLADAAVTALLSGQQPDGGFGMHLAGTPGELTTVK
ncbi:MAG TPA: hypothetical protein VK280_30480 [Streptosporangiaceae bacterium]|nr:hypothetical protein [Streptosporangiaceae bacterium]